MIQQDDLGAATATAEQLRTLLIGELASLLNAERADIETAKGFDEYGLDSFAGVVLLNAVEELLGTELEPELVMRQRCIDDIVETVMGLEGSAVPA